MTFNAASTGERGSREYGVEGVRVTRPAAEGPLRVLVVEDEVLIRWAVAETLTDAGHTVIQAADAAAALEVIAQASDPIDVALLDFRLPDSDDLSLLAKIRHQSPSTAVVMMTAFGTSQMTDEARSLGVHEVIAKPFDVRSIENVLIDAYHSKKS